MALVAAPAPLVVGVIGQARRPSVRAVWVISAGFTETGREARTNYALMPGPPWCVAHRPKLHGLLNGGPDPRFNVTFSFAFPPPGRLAVVTQSRGLGLLALADGLRRWPP